MKLLQFFESNLIKMKPAFPFVTWTEEAIEKHLIELGFDLSKTKVGKSKNGQRIWIQREEPKHPVSPIAPIPSQAQSPVVKTLEKTGLSTERAKKIEAAYKTVEPILTEVIDDKPPEKVLVKKRKRRKKRKKRS